MYLTLNLGDMMKIRFVFKPFSLLWLLTIFFFFSSASYGADSNQLLSDRYQLKKVFVFSRHSIRAPLTRYDDYKKNITPYTWQSWETAEGLLTPKGGELEKNVGQYARSLLNSYHFFNDKVCPNKNQILIYTNSLQRTIDTGKYFLDGAFPSCDFQVAHQAKIGEMDPLFNPTVPADKQDFILQNYEDLSKSVVSPEGLSGLDQKLESNYNLLENILNYKQGQFCLRDKKCHLTSFPYKLAFKKEDDNQLRVSGPSLIATGAIDDFLLEYYNGYDLSNVAWGKIKTDEQWKSLIDIKNYHMNLQFGIPAISKEAASPILNFIASYFDAQPLQTDLQRMAKQTLLTMLVGHDSNIVSLLSALAIKDFKLEGQFEETPIAGALIFQQWHDNKLNKDLMKIDYMYPSHHQIRSNMPFSENNNALHHVNLTMKDCETDQLGYCSMEKFKAAILGTLNK